MILEALINYPFFFFSIPNKLLSYSWVPWWAYLKLIIKF